MQGFPVEYHELVVVRYQCRNSLLQCGYIINVIGTQDDAMATALHREAVLEISQAYLRHATVDIGRTGFKNADYFRHPCGKRIVTARTEESHFVTDRNFQIARQHRADDDLFMAVIIQITPLPDQARNGRDFGFVAGLDAEDLQTVGAFLARHQRKTNAACGDLVRTQRGAQTIRGADHVGHHPAHFRVILITIVLDLDVPGKGLQGIVNHHVIAAKL